MEFYPVHKLQYWVQNSPVLNPHFVPFRSVSDFPISALQHHTNLCDKHNQLNDENQPNAHHHRLSITDIVLILEMLICMKKKKRTNVNYPMKVCLPFCQARENCTVYCSKMHNIYSCSHQHIYEYMCMYTRTHVDYNYYNTTALQAMHCFDAQYWRRRYEINHSYIMKCVCELYWALNGPA